MWGAATSKGYVAYVHGKALEAHDSYSKEAEDLLSKAVKLDPANVDAWNCLGQCFWKKKDLAAARDCFNGALAQKPNPESLRLLSMLLRQMGDTEAERAANVAESVNKAKEAIKMDVSDTESWCTSPAAACVGYVCGGLCLCVWLRLRFVCVSGSDVSSFDCGRWCSLAIPNDVPLLVPLDRRARQRVPVHLLHAEPQPWRPDVGNEGVR